MRFELYRLSLYDLVIDHDYWFHNVRCWLNINFFFWSAGVLNPPSVFSIGQS